MNRTEPIPGFAAGLLEAQGPCTTPLDLAVDYIRARIDRVLPLYVLAMVPHAFFTVWLIDAIVGERRASIAKYSAALALCMIWRWIWLSRLQYGVQSDLHDTACTPFWRRLPAVLWVRLVSHISITWGGILLGVPVFYGLYTGSFAGPLLFESKKAVTFRLRQQLSWIQHSARRLLRVIFVMSLLAGVMTVAMFVSQAILSETLLPSVFGIETADLNLTIGTWGWRLRMLYFLFLILDAFWTVAAVFLYYDSQSRRMAPDLRARLQTMVEISI